MIKLINWLKDHPDIDVNFEYSIVDDSLPVIRCCVRKIILGDIITRTFAVIVDEDNDDDKNYMEFLEFTLLNFLDKAYEEITIF